MLKVLLVDNEAIILKGLKQLIDWEKYGYTVAASARSASSAMEILESMPIDLVITDIKMPKMDGIDLIDHILSEKPNIKFIMISGYDEFEYVKKAIDFKISGFLLKPIDEDELIKILIDVRKSVISRRLYLNHMLYRIINMELTAKEEIDELKNELDLKADETFRYAIVKNNYYADNIEYTLSSENEEKTGQLAERIKNFLGDEFEHFAVSESPGGMGIVITSGMEKARGSLNELLEGVKTAAKDEDTKTCILVGKSVNELSELSESRDDIGHLTDILFYKDYDSILKFEDYKDEKFSGQLENTEFLDDFTGSVLNHQQIREYVDTFLEYSEKNRVSPVIFKAYINSIVILMIKNLMDAGGNAIELVAKHSVFHRASYVNSKICGAFLESISECYINLTEDIFASKGYVREIAEYVKNNYAEDISLSYFAKKYYLNTSYLGSMFKQKMGVNFSKYLTMVRMDEAKKLLKNGELKVYEVAAAVGVKDAGYFSRKFEEYTGISPSEYRKV